MSTATLEAIELENEAKEAFREKARAVGYGDLVLTPAAILETCRDAGQPASEFSRLVSHYENRKRERNRIEAAEAKRAEVAELRNRQATAEAEFKIAQEKYNAAINSTRWVILELESQISQTSNIETALYNGCEAAELIAEAREITLDSRRLDGEERQLSDRLHMAQRNGNRERRLQIEAEIGEFAQRRQEHVNRMNANYQARVDD